jgi:ACS family hexuronate transporter-like MFS transporter
VASVTGIGGMAGALGGILIAWAAGLLLKHFTELGKIEVGYGIMFIICGSAYLLPGDHAYNSSQNETGRNLN